jgi:hypothetical protein
VTDLFDRAVVQPSGCWVWTGNLDSKGYGRIRHKGQGQLVHRVAYDLSVGEIPEGLWVLHRCDNASCINPAHLFLGTPQDNVDDMIAKGRNAPPQRGEGNGMAILTADQVQAIRRLIAEGWRSCDLARHFGVSPGAVCHIKSGRTWAWLPTTQKGNDMTNDEIDFCIRYLQGLKQRQADDAMVRDIVADARRSPPNQPTSAMAEIHNQAQGHIHNHKGWVDAPKIDDWRAPGIDIIDRMVDQQDRIDREARRK